MISQFFHKIRETIDDSVDGSEISDEDKKKEQEKKRDQVYKKCGLSYFNGEKHEKLCETLELLKKEKIHVLETGELETTLKVFGTEYRKKDKWIVDAMSKISNLTSEEIQDQKILFDYLIGIADKN